jgi:hypothetical protein
LLPALGEIGAAMPAVNSGRSVSESPPRSSNVYISFETTSVVSPSERANTRGRLEHRDLDALEAIEPPDALERSSTRAKRALLVAEDVLGAADALGGFDRGYGALSRTRLGEVGEGFAHRPTPLQGPLAAYSRKLPYPLPILGRG